MQNWSVCVAHLGFRYWLLVACKHRLMFHAGAIDPSTKLPQPLQRDHVYDFNADRGDCSILRHNRDLQAFLDETDVVVQGTAHAPESVREMQASVSIKTGDRHIRTQTIDVIGDRTFYRSRVGQPLFSHPKPFTSQSTDWWYAFGGGDRNLFYPRNPCGRGYWGYLTEPHEGLALPNLEQPHDRLTPELMISPYRMTLPKPAGFGWVAPAWFPRSIPRPVRHSPGLASGMVLVPRRGASDGMLFPSFKGGEIILLSGFSRQGVIELRLPRFSERLLVYDVIRGHAFLGRTYLQMVSIDTDRGHVDLVWVTTFLLEDRYTRWLACNPQVQALFERFEVVANRQLLEAACWWEP